LYVYCKYSLGHALAYHGDTSAARAAADAAVETAAGLGGVYPGVAYTALAVAALAAGDVAAAQDASDASWRRLSLNPWISDFVPSRG
jgi:hypothetical protein